MDVRGDGPAQGTVELLGLERRRENCCGRRISARARTLPACQNTLASAPRRQVRYDTAAPSRSSMAWQRPRLGPRAHPHQRPLQVGGQHAVDRQRWVHEITRLPAVWQGLSMPTLSEDLAFRGLIHQVTDPALVHRLDTDRLTAYTGFDPTADSLHVGHLLQLCTLRRLQLAGHRPIALAGGGTGFIGDPGGKSEERTLLTRGGARTPTSRASGPSSSGSSTSAPTAATLGRCWSTTPTGWPALRLFEFLRDVGKHFTVNQMVAKDSVQVPARSRRRPGHLLHRVQLHAPAGLRLPPPVRRPTAAGSRSAAATSGATSPWGSIWSARSATTRCGG